LKAEKKTQEANSAGNEKNSMISLLKEKDILIDSLKRQLTEMREDLHQRESELEKAVFK